MKMRRILLAPLARVVYGFSLFFRALDEECRELERKAEKRRHRKEISRMLKLDPEDLEATGELEDMILARQVRRLRQIVEKEKLEPGQIRTTGSGDRPPPPRR